MTSTRVARVWHVVTLIVAIFALVLQLWIIATGRGFIFEGGQKASRPEQIRRYFSYFTIQSNFLVAVSMWLIVSGRFGTRLFRVVRLASVIGITVTGIVAYLLLQPPAGYSTESLLADRLLHIVVPVLAFVGWIAFGPRDRVGRDDIIPALGWPVAWLVATLALGPIFAWYPYPFINVDTIGLGRALLNCTVVAVLFVGLAFAAIWADRRLPGDRATMTE